MNQSFTSELFGTLVAVAASGGAFAASLAVGDAGGAWFPPAVAVLGVGFAAGLGSVSGAAVAALGGLLHAAATHVPVGPSVAGAAAIAWVLGSLRLAPARRWALAGPAGWGVAGAVETVSSGNGWNLTSLPAAVALGLLCGGAAAAVRFEDGDDRGWG